MAQSDPDPAKVDVTRTEGVGLNTWSAYFFLLFACASALAAIDFVRLDDLPSASAFEAFEATFALVTLLLLDRRVMATLLSRPGGEGGACRLPLRRHRSPCPADRLPAVCTSHRLTVAPLDGRRCRAGFARSPLVSQFWC